MTITQGARMAGAARAAALRDLSFHWSGAYEFAVTADGWTARRLDNGRSLVAGSPEELRALVLADYTAEAVPRGCGPDSAAD